MIEGRHYQNAYVTRDIDVAVAAFRASADVRQESRFDGALRARTPDGEGEIQTRLAFLWVGDLQFEFIEPVGGMDAIYRDALPADGSSRFHHICMRVDDWSGFRARVALQPLPVVLEGASGPLDFLYLDARATLGHYLEYTSMPDAMWHATGGR